MPMRRLPRSPCANWWMRSSASASCGSTRLATASRYWPACVGRRLRPSRSQICVPSCSSSLRIEWLSADWVRHSTLAAAVSEPCLSTSCTMLRWMRSSMSQSHGYVRNNHFTSWPWMPTIRLSFRRSNPHPMTQTHNLGFPRIGAKRELKFGLEAYWKGESSRDELKRLGADLRRRHGDHQAGLDLVPVGDFAFYDQVLDMSFTLGNLPERVSGFHGDPLDNYFRVARGRSAESAEQHHACCGGVAAGEMTKWFDTNYHYIVPEFTAATAFKLDASRLLEQLAEARQHGVQAKPVIVGPVTYLAGARPRTVPTSWPCCRRCW